MTKPRLTIIAGANGSGKTTLTSDIKFFHEIPLLDPDAIGKTLQSTMPLGFPVASARHVLTAAGEHIAKGESFAVETTLSGKGYLRMMLDARKRDFEIVLVYIGTENIETNLPASSIAFSRADTTFQKKMSGGALPEVSKIFQPPSNVRTTPSCSITQPTRVTA